MVLPGPQGTVQCPIRAPNEHSLHTEIMEKSLALFFYCYQSVVHLQSSLSLSLHSPQLSVSSFVSFLPSICPPLPPLMIPPCPVFPPCGMESDLWHTKGRGLAISIKALSYLLVSHLRRTWAYIVQAVITEHASKMVQWPPQPELKKGPECWK